MYTCILCRHSHAAAWPGLTVQHGRTANRGRQNEKHMLEHQRARLPPAPTAQGITVTMGSPQACPATPSAAMVCQNWQGINVLPRVHQASASVCCGACMPRVTAGVPSGMP
jgi:hypothetical protein